LATANKVNEVELKLLNACKSAQNNALPIKMKATKIGKIPSCKAATLGIAMANVLVMTENSTVFEKYRKIENQAKKQPKPMKSSISFW
jgi:hypothetical protein